MAQYYVYILECADGTLYVGSTNDIQKRLRAHNGELPGGARYTSGRRPVTLRYSEACTDRSAALKREHVVKNLSRSEKLKIHN
ncbi:MAG: endonuclease containing a domain [Parcubacteria group bacterium]|nr:endonuclease containing a domain [Parcubacteria group bacterium]